MIKRNDILEENNGRICKVIGVEDNVVYIKIIKVPFWDNPNNVGECDIILANDIKE